MTIEVHALQRMRVDTEAAGSFAVAKAIPGTFTDVPFSEGTAELTLTQAMLPAQTAQQYIDGYAKDIKGLKSAQLRFSMLLAPTGVAATNGVTAVQGALGKILAAIMGGERLGVGDLINDATPAVDNFDVTTAARFTAGSAIGEQISGLWEAREIESVVGSTLTLKHAFSGAPSNGSQILNSATYYLTEDPQTSLQFVVEGAEQSDRWHLFGGQGSFTIDTPIGELPRITFTIDFATWINLSDSALGAATYTNYAPRHIAQSEFLAQVVGTSTRNIVPCSSIQFTPQIAYIPIKTPGGTETILRWRRNRAVPAAQIQFSTYYEAYATWFQERDDRDDYHFALTIGNGVAGAQGNMVLLTVPTAQITDVQRIDDGGISGQRVIAKARLDADATDQTTEIRRSPFRIHLL